jgi:adiponectin receptor
MSPVQKYKAENKSTDKIKRRSHFCFCCAPPYNLVKSKMVEEHRVYPFIEGSYRPQMNFTRSLQSVAYLHNQSLNIWIHLFGIVLFAYTAVVHFTDNDKKHMLTTTIDLTLSVVFFVSCLLMLSLSAVYHTFEPVNKSVYGIVLSCDLLGTALSIMGSIVYGIWIVLRCLPTYRNVYIALVLVSCSGMIIVATNASWRGNLMLVIPIFGIGTASGLIPAIHFAALSGTKNFQGNVTLACVFIALGLMIVGISVFLSRYPEKRYPLKFDLVGSSHQLWHICVMISPYILYQGLVRALCNCTDENNIIII